ncbi:uncharacterized protein LOC111711545 [Eurytemora carolleeae]|uniref:uncharacterized protein LOC111711545 n=1 Tax=Eurytemora carolleeae TaxID=1294199 RepID=UPI000C75CEBE|nr:uncharacterized protein LOC111711545 [Eurytemora carolleeae]|eukprot:XP_023341697.1 uncharacterized protein LOC111711545 [Eurytemora affinis]
MSRDVGLWAKSCIPCQKSKISTHIHSTVPSIPVPIRRFSHVHVDIVGPLPSSQGLSYLLTMIDRTTRWPEVVRLSSISAESCVCAFISTWISRFGVPAVLTSDRGSQFTSSIWNGVCSVLGRLAGSDWFSHLPLVLLGLRATPKDDTGPSVSEAVYGSPLTLPSELVDVPELPPESFQRKVDRAIDGFAIPPPHHVCPVPPSQLPSALLTAKFVFVPQDAVIPTLAHPYPRPYLVLERQSKYFRLQIGSKQDVVSVDCLKPVFSDAPVTPALPPPRGRPSRCPVASSSDPPPSSTGQIPKRVRFQLVPQILPPPTPARHNPYRTSRDRRICSATSLPFLLGGLLWRL